MNILFYFLVFVRVSEERKRAQQDLENSRKEAAEAKARARQEVGHVWAGSVFGS